MLTEYWILPHLYRLPADKMTNEDHAVCFNRSKIEDRRGDENLGQTMLLRNNNA